MTEPEPGPEPEPEVVRALRAVGLGLAPQPEGGHAVTGDTFPHRELLKRLGARWSGSRRLWLFGAGPGPGLREQAAPVETRGWGTKHYHGHRERLRTRFAETRGEGLADYELLELLLFFAVHRRDTKPIAKAMLERFGSLAAVLAAPPERYAECFGLAPLDPADGRAATRDDDLRFTQVLLKAVQAAMERALKEPLREATLVSSWAALVDYLRAGMAHDPTEQFRILFLDRKNQLIRDERQSRGTVDHTPLYPREVVRRCLELGASAIIMVHNHPSGDPTPSKADIAMTRQVVDALETVGVTVHDHVIIGRNRHISFKAEKLM